VVGNIMAGLLGGIMLARPFASMVAASLGWRALFWISAVLMASLIAVLWRVLPERRPHASIGYARTMASLRASCGTRRCCAGAGGTRE
jgi:predicted MFS family arabinose efflux permease